TLRFESDSVRHWPGWPRREQRRMEGSWSGLRSSKRLSPATGIFLISMDSIPEVKSITRRLPNCDRLHVKPLHTGSSMEVVIRVGAVHGSSTVTLDLTMMNLSIRI